jgi:pimeloyl-ACP methyl ester carboxylesterase
MPFADVNGQHLAFDDSGGDGPAIIFSHGFLMGRTMFEPQVEALRGEFRCITWDERGFGDTPVDGAYTFWDSADDALALLSSLGIDRAFFAGMSQGGFISLRVALRAPERVLGLGLIDTQAGTEAPEAAPLYEAMAAQWAAEGPTGDLAETVASLIMSPGYDHSGWVATWLARPKESITIPFRTLMDRDDITDRLGEITAPAIIFHGEVDASIPMDKAVELCEGLPNCEALVRIPGAGHASNLSHPDAVNGPLLDFLRRHAAT